MRHPVFRKLIVRTFTSNSEVMPHLIKFSQHTEFALTQLKKTPQV